MSNEEMPKIYTVAEARALIPRLRTLLSAIQAERQQLKAATESLQRLTPSMRGNGQAAEAARLERLITRLGESLRGHIAEVSGLDVEIKDLDTGLVDFLSMREGRIVYLCWRVDEPTVAYWHELNTGFRGRQPLEE